MSDQERDPQVSSGILDNALVRPFFRVSNVALQRILDLRGMVDGRKRLAEIQLEEDTKYVTEQRQVRAICLAQGDEAEAAQITDQLCRTLTHNAICSYEVQDPVGLTRNILWLHEEVNILGSREALYEMMEPMDAAILRPYLELPVIIDKDQ